MRIGELNNLYQESEGSLEELFAEQRSNVLLVSGNHYNKKKSKFWRNLRSNQKIDSQQKLRLTKNHIHKISKTYQNNILSYAPAVGVLPRNESELSDTKAAELNSSVWEDVKIKHDYSDKVRQWVNDYIDIGEVILKIIHDDDKGKFLGYEQVYNENEEIVEVARFSGDITLEKYYGFNTFTDPSADSFEESRYVILRKMTSTKGLRKRYIDDDDKLSYIDESAKTTYKIFDGTDYRDSKGLTLLREYYFRPCKEYPNGYFYITTESGVLEEGELPEGEFPILYCGFDSIPTTARHHSIIKQLRPYQAEINRSASKIAEHQITLGDDKIILNSGGSISPGGTAHGIKAVKVQGGKLDVLTGRSGAQYLDYMNSQIAEMYNVANVREDSQDNAQQGIDVYALLHRSIREKKKFVIYGDKFGDFLIKVTDRCLTLKKRHLSEEELIPIIGKNERVNIPEFKSTSPLCYQIKLIQQSEDLESKLGKQLAFNHIMQYGGKQLSRDDLGKLIRTMPYVNDEEALKDLTMDYDNAVNDILSLDRGEWVPPSESDDDQYLIKKLSQRIKSADFKYLSPKIQEMYRRKRKLHEQIVVKKTQQAQMAQSGFIPSGGYLLACDFYVPHPTDPKKQPRRARLPYEAVAWLVQKLEQQGSPQSVLQSSDTNQMSRYQQLGMGQPPRPQIGPGGGQTINMRPS